MNFNTLTKEEENIILRKGTEKPFNGEYDNFFREGLYICKRCNAPLYRSEYKFDAKCGWPSFDEEITGATRSQANSDGERMEVLCVNCGAHLGHIFLGENLTEKNTRHCVNSLSLRFIPKSFQEGEENFAVFAGGCFWHMEAILKKLRGVISVVSGYAGGYTKDPVYEDVKTGETGHAESVKIVYDPKIISYGNLLEVFFNMHDPTALNKQGADIGTQYRSAVFYKTLDQKEETEKKIKELTDKKVFKNKIVTEVSPLTEFYTAEEYHQRYFEKQPSTAYCQTMITPALRELEEKFGNLIKK